MLTSLFAPVSKSESSQVNLYNPYSQLQDPILPVWNASIKRKAQVALWVDLGRCCYYAGGINDSCAQCKSKMGWSEVAT